MQELLLEVVAGGRAAWADLGRSGPLAFMARGSWGTGLGLQGGSRRGHAGGR
jgi:hypothetical protein